MIEIEKTVRNYLWGRVQVNVIRPKIRIRVLDVVTGAYALVPFLIDTGSPVTIIPRSLLKTMMLGTRMFTTQKVTKAFIGIGLDSTVHSALLFLDADTTVALPKTYVFVTEDYPQKPKPPDPPEHYGLLGMNELQHLEMRLDVKRTML